MNILANKNLLSMEVISFGEVIKETRGGLPAYESIATRLLDRVEQSITATNRIIHIAESAYSCRRMDIVETMGSVLLQVPLSRNQHGAGEYYLGLAEKRKGNFKQAAYLFDRVAGVADSEYTAKALCSTGALLLEQGKIEESLSLRIGAIKALGKNRFCPVWLELQMAVAIVKSLQGDHKYSLRDLKQLYPLVNVISKKHPTIPLKFLNSLAVELCEVGYLKAAHSIITTALTSPYISAYPEVLQTRLEIEEKAQRASHAVLAVPELPVEKTNVLDFPIANRAPHVASNNGQSGVVNLIARKAEMKKNQQKKEQQKQLSKGDKIAEIVKLLYRTDEKEIDATLDRLNKHQTEHTSKP